MPRKVQTPVSKLQNKESQRRSRARRRDLVEALQARVAEYERRDARATIEVQRAARAVTVQNARLRALLLERGVSQEDIDTCLAQPIEQLLGDAASGSRLEDYDDDDDGHAINGGSFGRRPMLHAKTAGTHGDSGTRHNHDGIQALLTAATCKGPDAFESSCDDAAEIIANYKGHSDVASARASLGCRDSDACFVNNITVFQAMDDAS